MADRVRRYSRGDRRLGRHVVHDPRSMAFPMRGEVDTATWRTRSVRLYDPWPNPDQPRGNCTGCDSCMGLNAVDNRRTGRVLKMDNADAIYSLATELDPWEGSWPPEDTGSSGLAAAKAAQMLGFGGEYRWALSGGADMVVQQIMEGRTVGVGTVWTYDMFDRDGQGFVVPTGNEAGGHQWRARGYIEPLDAVVGRCWWGEWRDFLIKREHLNDLLLERWGDAYTQVTA